MPATTVAGMSLYRLPMMSQLILMHLLQKAEDATCRLQAQQIIIHYNLVLLLIERDRTSTPG